MSISVLLSNTLARFVTMEAVVSFPIPESTTVTFSKDFSDIVFVVPGYEDALMYFGVFSFDGSREYGCSIYTETQDGPRSMTLRTNAFVNEEIRMDLLQRNGLVSGRDVLWSSLIGDDVIVAPAGTVGGSVSTTSTVSTRRTKKRSRVLPQSF